MGLRALVSMVAVLTATASAGALSSPGSKIRPAGAAGGLDTDVVTAILQDRAGLIWIGTREGLFLHDGYGYTRFDHDPADPESISGNTVRTIYEDSKGDLWIGTNTAGLNRLDRATWRFEAFRHDSADPHSLSHDSVYALAEDADGGLWVGTQIGLNRFEPETRRFKRFLAADPATEGLGGDYVMALLAHDDGSLWIATRGAGLHRRDPLTGSFDRYIEDADDPYSLSTNFVHALARAPGGELWVGSGLGVQRFEPDSGRFLPLISGAEPWELLPDVLVSALAVGEGDDLWIGTWGGGVAHFDSATGTVESFREEEEDNLGGAADRITAMIVDAGGSLWLGTWGAGLRRLHSAHDIFEFTGKADEGRGLSSGDATAVIEDSRGGLWVGTYGRGLNHREAGARNFRVYEAEGQARSVFAVSEGPEGGIWFGTMWGVRRLDPRTGRIDSWRHDDADDRSLGPGYVTALLFDRSGRLWVGTGEGGLNLMNADGAGFERFAHDLSDPGSLSDDYISAILEDRRGRLWVGTRSGGLNLSRGEPLSFERFAPDPADPTSLSHHRVTSILEDSRGTIWVGTEGGGLNQVVETGEESEVSFTHLTERDGLIDDNVMGIAEDDDGSLWLATRHGLSRFSPDTSRFVNYDKSDGLPSLAFNAASFAGEKALHFGTTVGLVSIRTGTPFPDPRPSPTLLTSMSTLEGHVRGEKPVWQLDRVSVNYGQVLTIEFAVLDFDEARRHRYAYRMNERRSDWIDVGPRRQLTFTDLEPGVHTLEVRGRNRQGIWSAAPTALRIEVVPPFWMTWWFRASLMLALVAAIITGHRVRTATLRRRNRVLVGLKEERERALHEAHESSAALQATYDQLRRLNRRLEAAKEDERKRIARELHDEMGQALTAAKINLQLLTTVDDSGRRARRVADTVALVDRMIGHVRELSLDLRPPLLDELGLEAALRGYLEAQARRTGLKIDFVTCGMIEEEPADVEITTFRVVQEAVTNTIRHAHASGVRVELGRDASGLDLSIADDGAGFDVEFALASAAEGRHLGLLGIRERVESLGGSVEIDSQPGRGTTIRARIPVEQERRSLARTAG